MRRVSVLVAAIVAGFMCPFETCLFAIPKASRQPVPESDVEDLLAFLESL
jgi:hypothetical protein